MISRWRSLRGRNGVTEDREACCRRRFRSSDAPDAHRCSGLVFALGLRPKGALTLIFPASAGLFHIVRGPTVQTYRCQLLRLHVSANER